MGDVFGVIMLLMGLLVLVLIIRGTIIYFRRVKKLSPQQRKKRVKEGFVNFILDVPGIFFLISFFALITFTILSIVSWIRRKFS